MGPGQISRAHQKLLGYFASGELEMLFEQFYPFLQFHLGLRIQPVFERPVFLLNFQNFAGIVNYSVDFEFVADDAGIRKQTSPVFVLVSGNFLNVKIAECLPEILLLVQNRGPGKTGLVNLQNQSPKEFIV